MAENDNARRVAFVSTRIAGTDGVSLEIAKWAHVLERAGVECYYIAGDDLLRYAFPPTLPRIQHVVINSPRGEEFSRRTGLSCGILPNVMDFANTHAITVEDMTK